MSALETFFLFLYYFRHFVLTTLRTGMDAVAPGLETAMADAFALAKSILNRHSINNRRNKISGKGIACCCRINSTLKDSLTINSCFILIYRNRRPQEVSERLLPLDKVLSLRKIPVEFFFLR